MPASSVSIWLRTTPPLLKPHKTTRQSCAAGGTPSAGPKCSHKDVSSEESCVAATAPRAL
eukprot:6208219-Pleurochrysis_carterae.AAC.1